METDHRTILAHGRVRAVCVSRARGTEKQAVPEGHFLVDFGIQGDAHAGNWHRQVSLLSYDKVEAFNQRGAGVADGAFGENLVVEGIDFASLPVGTILCAGTVQLEMTQPLRHLQADGRMHHAKGGRFRQGDPGGDDPSRR